MQPRVWGRRVLPVARAFGGAWLRGRVLRLLPRINRHQTHHNNTPLTCAGAFIPVINGCASLDAATRALGLDRELREGVLFL
jgi:hypothetical protein